MDLDIKVACAFIQVCAFIRVKPLLQVLKEQVKALQERIGDLEKESAGNKMDSAHLAQLEAHVQQFQKGTCCLMESSHHFYCLSFFSRTPEASRCCRKGPGRSSTVTAVSSYIQLSHIPFISLCLLLVSTIVSWR